jgi:hypothetical protein
MLIIGVYGMISAEMTEALSPLGGWAEKVKVEIQFGHPENVSFGFVDGGADLRVFVAAGVDW